MLSDARKEGYNGCVTAAHHVAALAEAVEFVESAMLGDEHDEDAMRLVGKLEATIYHLENY